MNRNSTILGSRADTGFHRTIAIIGGGFSGTMLAVHLLQNAGPFDSIVLIERGPLPGRGVAYGSDFEGHLLNVRAKNMSAYPDIPDHFVKWAQQNHSVSVKPDDYLPRPVYGQYIASQLREAVRCCPGKLRCIQDEVISVSQVDGIAKITLTHGQIIKAVRVVLALGNFPPADLALPGKTTSSTRFLANPWSAKKAFNTNQDKSVLLIGSGLTSVDTVLELRALGFDGVIHILSRHGLLPQSHKLPLTPLAPAWIEESTVGEAPRTVRGLLRLVRHQVRSAEASGLGWRAVVDSLRPITQKLWKSLPLAEKRRFLRHVRTYWDIHRHRIAARIADQLALQIRGGSIKMHAGRITEYQENAEHVDITYRDRKCGVAASLRVDRVVNCTGPEGDLRRTTSPLLADLIGKKLVRADEVSLGLDISADGALLDADGRPSDFLYALGPLRKGKLWESIAVPELRVQAQDLAMLLLENHAASEAQPVIPVNAGLSASMPR
jgi:uncharacterized NAD(P)/FAD-binding protein YdhS